MRSLPRVGERPAFFNKTCLGEAGSFKQNPFGSFARTQFLVLSLFSRRVVFGEEVAGIEIPESGRRGPNVALSPPE